MIHLRRLSLGIFMVGATLIVNAVMSRVVPFALWSPVGLLLLLAFALIGLALYALGWLVDELWLQR